MLPRRFATPSCAQFCTFASYLSAIGWLILPLHIRGEEGRPSVEQGRQLFVHRWQVSDELSVTGDGLGPLHNATSCIECHNQSGVGGAGPVGKNVELLSIASTASTDKKRFAMQMELRRIHPAFDSSPNLVLHKRSTFHDYDVFRLRLFGARVSNTTNDADKSRMQSKLASRQESNLA
jgi:hypothetical protein